MPLSLPPDSCQPGPCQLEPGSVRGSAHGGPPRSHLYDLGKMNKKYFLQKFQYWRAACFTNQTMGGIRFTGEDLCFN